jgi:hypothetical protein
MSVVTQLYFQIVEENNYMFRPFSGWAIIRLRLEYRRKLIYCNVDIKNGGTRSHFTMLGEVRSSGVPRGVSRNSEVLPKLSRISSNVEYTSVTT